MDYLFFIFLTIAFFLIVFTKMLEVFLNKKAKARNNSDEALLKKRQDPNILFLRDNFSNSISTGKLLKPITFKPKISKFFSLLFIFFFVCGIAFTFIDEHSKEKTLIERFFPLILSIYGLFMLLGFYSTKYELNNSSLRVYRLFNELIEICYSDIIEIEKRKISMTFKHGSRGRIRRETCEETLFITSSKPIKNRNYVIMISPKNIDEFMNVLKIKL